MVECLMAGGVQSFKEQIKAQYESLPTIPKILDGLRKRVGA